MEACVLVHLDADDWAAAPAAQLLRKERSITVRLVPVSAISQALDARCVWLLQMATGSAAKVFGPEGVYDEEALEALLARATRVGVIFCAMHRDALAPILRDVRMTGTARDVLALEQPFFKKCFGGHPVDICTGVYCRGVLVHPSASPLRTWIAVARSVQCVRFTLPSVLFLLFAIVLIMVAHLSVLMVLGCLVAVVLVLAACIWCRPACLRNSEHRRLIDPPPKVSDQR